MVLLRKVKFSTIVGLAIKPNHMRKNKKQKILYNSKADYKPFKIPDSINEEHIRKIFKEPQSNEEIREMRSAFNMFHELCYQSWVQHKQNNQTLEITINEESNIIYPGEYRRAS